jgi:hypothetical protein
VSEMYLGSKEWEIAAYQTPKTPQPRPSQPPPARNQRRCTVMRGAYALRLRLLSPRKPRARAHMRACGAGGGAAGVGQAWREWCGAGVESRACVLYLL